MRKVKRQIFPNEGEELQLQDGHLIICKNYIWIDTDNGNLSFQVNTREKLKLKAFLELTLKTCFPNK